MQQDALDLNSLSAQERPGLTRNDGGGLAECAMVCLDQNGHLVPVLVVTGTYEARLPILGPTVTNVMRRAHNDHKVAAERGACGVGLLLLENYERLVVYERSPQDGGGFDYFLIPADQVADPLDDNFFADATMRLEVSGILSGNSSDIDKRVREKIRRLKRIPSPLSAYIIVVDFGDPIARIVKYEPGT